MKEDRALSAFRRFLVRKDIEFSFRRYGIEAAGAMALGLFASLLMGTIITTVAQQLVGVFGETATLTALLEVGRLASAATGAAMAVAIGHALKSPPLVLFSLAAVGLAANALGGAGGPLAVLLVTIVAAECGKVVSRETPVDIIVTPGVTLMVGILLAMGFAPGIGAAAISVGDLVLWATDMQPFFMGMLVSVLVGMALTLPISSAAICAVLGLVGLAGGAALAGCCAQMVGFAVMSYPENRLGGLLAQGLGTSMLQIPNIMRNPRIWIPPTLASAITGPLATTVFGLQMNGAPLSAGMGTSGMVGPIGVMTGWANPGERALEMGAQAMVPGFIDWLGLLLIAFVLPAVLNWLFAGYLRKIGWIRPGDLRLSLS